AETVAVVESDLLAVYLDTVTSHLGDSPQRLAHVFRTLGGVYPLLATMEEIVGSATVEALFRIRLEAVAATTRRGGHQIGAAIENGVELLAIPGGDVLDVIEPLEAPLNLEGANACRDQRLQIVGLIHVLERQQVTVGHQ